MVGQPALVEPSPEIVSYFTTATAELSTGVLTHWLLGTSMADQTVVIFAVGVPDFAMDQYSEIALEMFNSAVIDTEITSQLVE